MHEADDKMSYKTLHEQFVSGHSGSTYSEVFIVSTIIAASAFFRDTFYFLFSDFPDKWMLSCVLDFITITLPFLLSLTLMCDYGIHLLLLILTTGLTILVYKILSDQNLSLRRQPPRNLLDIDMGIKRPFLTNVRASTSMSMAISVLAVDFKIFPRRFAKTELFGIGVMDIGVGCYIISNALVSPEARGKWSGNRSLKARLKDVVVMIKSCSPLIIIGVMRCIAVKSVDYQEHVTEYGVHWNFFITLAVVKILSTLVFTLIPPKFSAALSLFSGCFYQYLLSNGLHVYIVNGVDGAGGRHGIIDSNREGIYSCAGYLSLYFAGVSIGMIIFQNRKKLKDWLVMFLLLISISAVAGSWLTISTSSIQQVSRRFANLPFILWIICLTTFVIGMHLLGDILITSGCYLLSFFKGSTKKQSESEVTSNVRRHICLLDSMNYNGLLYFLLANLLTGMVNMTFKTIYMEALPATIILICYMLVLSVLVTFLRSRNIVTKIW